MDDADDLAEALDRVLRLSGNDPDKAIEALNRRHAVHEDSTTCSTVSSPATTASSRSIPLPDKTILLPSQVHSSSSSKRPLLPTKPPSRKSKRRVYTFPAGSQLTITVPSEATHGKATPTASTEVTSDSDNDATYPTPSPTPRTKGPRELHSPTPRDLPLPAGRKTAHNAAGSATQPLPLVLLPALAVIRPEESELSLVTFTSLRRSIAADPHYLGEPCHIFLRNPGHVTTRRRMVVPPSDAIPPGKWYAISCGSSVGIFLSWLDASPHVNGKSCSVHKSFRSKSDAYLWLQVALLKGLVRLIN